MRIPSAAVRMSGGSSASGKRRTTCPLEGGVSPQRVGHRQEECHRACIVVGAGVGGAASKYPEMVIVGHQDDPARLGNREHGGSRRRWSRTAFAPRPGASTSAAEGAIEQRGTSRPPADGVMSARGPGRSPPSRVAALEAPARRGTAHRARGSKHRRHRRTGPRSPSARSGHRRVDELVAYRRQGTGRAPGQPEQTERDPPRCGHHRVPPASDSANDGGSGADLRGIGRAKRGHGHGASVVNELGVTRWTSGMTLVQRLSSAVHWLPRRERRQGERRMEPRADIGLIGLAVMGENLVLNMESHGYTVAVFNRTTSKVDDFVAGRGQGEEDRRRATRVKELVAALKRPRKVMIMVKAGPGGRRGHRRGRPPARARRHPHRRRQHPLPRHHPPHREPSKAKGLLFIGTGVSGGEEGRAQGPVDHARRRPRRPGRTSSRSSRPSPPRSPTARPAATGSAPRAPATTSRWSTTASSTATCSSSARRTTC